MSVVVYLVRHGEVEHHRTDVSLTPRGRAQAEAAGAALADHVADGDTVSIQHSPVKRVVETAELLRDGLSSALTTAGRIAISPPGLDVALSNVRFYLEPGKEPQEPSLYYSTINTPAFLQSVSPARAEFYRGFWRSNDPMGYWLTHDSAGAAEPPEVVLARVQDKLRGLFAEHSGKTSGHLRWIGVTHSGAMRNVLRAAFGEDPGEPDFCGIITVEATDSLDCATLAYRGRTALLSLIAASRG